MVSRFKLWVLAFVLLGFASSCHFKSDISTSQTSEEKDVKVEAPFIHSVYFWFKEEVTADQKAAFAKASMKLREIDGVTAVYEGVPAATDRPIVERSYDYALVVLMKDLATHDAYQQDPTHLKLLEDYGGLWEKVMVTDVDPKK